MSSQPFVKLQDLVDPGRDAASSPLVADGLLGAWQNTDPGTQRIARAVIEPGPGPTGLVLRTSGAHVADRPDVEATLIEWLFASAPGGREAVAFTARAEGPTAAVELHANVSKGLLILTHMTTYRPGSGLRDEFAREFFRRSDGDAR